MEAAILKKILLVGENSLTGSVAINLLKADFEVFLLAGKSIEEAIEIHKQDIERYCGEIIDVSALHYVDSYEATVDLVILITEENREVKNNLLKKLDPLFGSETIIAINTDSFLLSDIREGTTAPERILGVNWTDPAHTTKFMEIISDEITSAEKTNLLKAIGEERWKKDPYVVKCGYSVRARLVAALAREAMYLVEHGYATFEDIDRANRNDAGYYLPFAGNCRYMDLMGTYAYGLVMKDLNRELSKADKVPVFFDKLVEDGKSGLATTAGFYNYDEKEVEDWFAKSRKFSYEISEIIERFPFGYLTEPSTKQINEKTSHI